MTPEEKEKYRIKKTDPRIHGRKDRQIKKQLGPGRPIALFYKTKIDSTDLAGMCIEDLIRVVYEAGRSGDIDACKFLISRYDPMPKGQRLTSRVFGLYQEIAQKDYMDMVNNILLSTMKGDISAQEAKDLTALVGEASAVYEKTTLANDVQKLKEQAQSYAKG